MEASTAKGDLIEEGKTHDKGKVDPGNVSRRDSMPSLRSAMTTLTNSPRLLRRVFRRSSSDNTGEATREMASSCRGHGADTDSAAEAAADSTDSKQTAQTADNIPGSASPEVGLELRPR